MVLPGAHIGEGVVVQAGSVVMGSIPPCAIAAGNPGLVFDLDRDGTDVMLSARATHLAGVPYMYEVLDRFRFFEREFPALKGLLVSGGALAPALRRKFAEESKVRGISFCEGYGQTETTGVMATIRTDLMPERAARRPVRTEAFACS